MADDGLLEVEIIYALPDTQTIISLRLPPGSTVADALAQSGMAARHPETGAAPSVGIFGKLVPLTSVLEANDRVEIYRPLVADPKLARRARAAAAVSRRR